MNPVVELDRVSVRYGRSWALRDVSASFPPGAVGLLGPNGAGKSTMLKALLAFVTPDKGEMRVLNLDVRKKAPRGTFFSSEDAWFNTEAFAANEKVNVRWYLIRKGIVANSTRKTWGEQRALLGPNEEVPRACEFVYAVVLYYLVRGERLFPRVYARCSDLDSNGRRVDVGRFDAHGLDISFGGWDDFRRGDFGLASVRKAD